MCAGVSFKTRTCHLGPNKPFTALSTHGELQHSKAVTQQQGWPTAKVDRPDRKSEVRVAGKPLPFINSMVKKESKGNGEWGGGSGVLIREILC